MVIAKGRCGYRTGEHTDDDQHDDESQILPPGVVGLQQVKDTTYLT